MLLKKITLFLFLVFSFLGVYAQLDGVQQEDVKYEDNLFLNGKVTDYYSGDIISGVKISAVVGGKVIAKGVSDSKGEFKLVIDFNKEYTINFSKAGLISKKITMNSFGVPEKKRFGCPDMNAEITLFKPNDCIKADMLEKPIGKAIYFPKRNVIDWDMDFSMPRLAALNKMLDDCEKQAKEQAKAKEAAEKKYNSFMKIANKAFMKEDWENATSNYKAALKIYPDKKEPINKLNLIAIEISKKAEAEKQRIEEKARAEAEKKAKAEKELASKKAREEGLAKEKAKKEMLAKEAVEAKEKEKAVLAAKKAATEKLAKEKAKTEAKERKEAELKAKAKKEAELKRQAELKAKEEENIALTNMKNAEKDKLKAKKEVAKRQEAENKALAEKEIAKNKEIKERKAKDLAAQKAQKAENERAENQKILSQVKEDTKKKIIQQEQQEKDAFKVKDIPQKKEQKGRSLAIKVKKKDKSRYLYTQPNKHVPGKGPRPKKRIVF